MKHFLFPFLSCLISLSCFAQDAQTEVVQPSQKTIDEGGSGPFKAIAVKEAGAEDFVVYHPKDIMYLIIRVSSHFEQFSGNFVYRHIKYFA